MNQRRIAYIGCKKCGNKLTAAPTHKGDPGLRYALALTLEAWYDTPELQCNCGAPRTLVTFDLNGKRYAHSQLQLLAVE